MTARTRPVSPRTVAKNRYDEASRVRDAYAYVLRSRKRAGHLPSIREAEDQLDAAEAAETAAWNAWKTLSA